MIITSVRQFVELVVKEIALCGEDGASPAFVIQNTIATFSIQDLSFHSLQQPFDLLRLCWDPLLGMNGDVLFAKSWHDACNGKLLPPLSAEDAATHNVLLFGSRDLQLHALGARPWIAPYIFSSKHLLVLKHIARAREKGVLTCTLLHELDIQSSDVHHLLDALKTYSLVSSRKCHVTIDASPIFTNLWHLASLPAASMPLASDAHGGIRVHCPSFSDQDLDFGLEILQKAGGSLPVDEFMHQVGCHPELKEKGSSLSPGTGFSNLLEMLIQQRYVRRTFIFVQSSCRYKIPALQIYDPSDIQLPESSYPFQLLPNLPLTDQVKSFIHECGCYGCTSSDIVERLGIPRKLLERILSLLNSDEFCISKQCVGKSQAMLYKSKLTFAEEPAVFKLKREASISDTKQENPSESKPPTQRPTPVHLQNMPWQHLGLNDLQLSRLDVTYSFLKLHPVCSVYLLYSHLSEHERLSNAQFRICRKTFNHILEIILPFVEETHVARSVVMRDGVTFPLLMPSSMPDDHPAVAREYKRQVSFQRELRSKRLGAAHLGKGFRNSKSVVASDVPEAADAAVHKKKCRRKVKRIIFAEQPEDSDVGDAPDDGGAASADSRDVDISSDSNSSMDDASHQLSYSRLLGTSSVFIKAYMLHSFILSKNLSTITVEGLLSVLPYRHLIHVIGIPNLKNRVLFALLQELQSLPAHAMDCSTLPRAAVLNMHNKNKNKSGFYMAWNLLFRLSLLKRPPNSLLSHLSRTSYSHEAVVSQSIVIQSVTPDMFEKISMFGCTYYEPSLCVFSLRNSTELRQLWMFFKQFAFDVDSDTVADPIADLSLPDAHLLPDILKNSCLFRHDFKTYSDKKRPSGWSLHRFSGPVVTKLTKFLKKTKHLQDALENLIFPHRWLINIVPQILVYDFFYGGLDIFVEYRNTSSSQHAQLSSLLDSQNLDDGESDDAPCQYWNLDSESKLLAFVLLYYSDKMRPGRIPCGQELVNFCKRVNWKLVSRFVHECGDACRNHFVQIAPTSQFAAAVQTVRDKFPTSVTSQTITTQMALELANEIRLKILMCSDSLEHSIANAKVPLNSNLPWRACFNDCLAAGLVMKRTFCADHYDPSVASAAAFIDSQLSPEQVLVGSSCLASFGASKEKEKGKVKGEEVEEKKEKKVQWSDIPKIVSDKLKVDKAPSSRLSLHQRIQDFSNGLEYFPTTIAHVKSGLDAVALAVLHIQGQLQFEHEWHIANRPSVRSKKISMSDYLYNQGILKLRTQVSEDCPTGNQGIDSLLPEFDDTSRYMYHLNGPDIKLIKRRHSAIADLDCDPSCWKTDFPSETVDRAVSFVHHQGASGVDMRQVCDAVGIDAHDAVAFRRHLLSGLLYHIFNLHASHHYASQLTERLFLSGILIWVSWPPVNSYFVMPLIRNVFRPPNYGMYSLRRTSHLSSQKYCFFSSALF
jgi:hypothetical protein